MCVHTFSALSRCHIRIRIISVCCALGVLLYGLLSVCTYVWNAQTTEHIFCHLGGKLRVSMPNNNQNWTDAQCIQTNSTFPPCQWWKCTPTIPLFIVLIFPTSFETSTRDISGLFAHITHIRSIHSIECAVRGCQLPLETSSSSFSSSAIMYSCQWTTTPKLSDTKPQKLLSTDKYFRVR